MIPLSEILTRLQAFVPPEQAREVLAVALAQTCLPVKEHYMSGEVMAIGAAIAHAQQALLAGSDLPAAQELAAAMGPVLDAIAQDHPQSRA
jgi:hypothetical protein